MGEYATRTSDGERVKIGTCEDMYYLRADQRQLVTWERGNVDPNSDDAFSGAVKLVQQKLLRDGRLVPVCQCGGCGAAWRIEEPSEIEALAVAFRAEGDGRIQQSRDKNPCEGAFWHTIADRILEGAKLTADVEG